MDKVLWKLFILNYRVLKEHQNDELDEKLTAVYPSTEGLQQARLRKLTEQALLTLSHDKQSLVELLPEDILTKTTLCRRWPMHWHMSIDHHLMLTFKV